LNPRSAHGQDRFQLVEALLGCIVCLPEPVPISYVLQTYFAGAAPASTLCILRGLANPNFLLEIEAIAAV
jgi:enamine deaminase RidA (YjgF/YER057c/UK114 family)